ncbi:MAG: molybdopterin cofactor-binding domain-containing protein [Pseudomonadales bacterium]
MDHCSTASSPESISWTSWRTRPARTRSGSAASCDAPHHQCDAGNGGQHGGLGRAAQRLVRATDACHSSFGTIVAQVVDVTVNAGAVKVDRVVCAVDAGMAVTPDGLAAQMESGIIFGLTAALYGNIEIENGAVKQSNFHDYQMVRMKDAPQIDVHIIDSGHSMGGAGEPGTPGVAPALANAVFAATGTRVRELPLSQYDLSYRIEEREEVI